MLSVKRHWQLILACAIALLNIGQTGIVNGWTSPVLARLQSNDSTLPTTSDEGSWIATAVPLGSIFCTPLAAISVEYLGRKLSILITIFPFLVSWIMISVATSVTELIAARGVEGMGMAFAFSITPIYLGEIAPDQFRGGIGLCMTVIGNIGILWIYGFGTLPKLWQSSIPCALPLLLVLVFYPWLPESPYYLAINNRREEAIKQLKRLRNSEDMDDEMKKIESTILNCRKLPEKPIVKETARVNGSIGENNEKVNGDNSKTNEENKSDNVGIGENEEDDEVGNRGVIHVFKEIFTQPCHRRALMISIGSFTISQFTGGITFVFYAHLIFQKAGTVSPNTLSMIKAVLQLVTSIGSAYVVDSVGKRPLLIISCLGSTIFMTSEGVYFYLLDNGYDVDSIWWLPLASMILFNIFQVIGLSSIPLAFLGELFHPRVKSLAVCISKTYLSLSVFIVGKMFQILMDSFGNCVPFFVFAVVGILGAIFVIFLVPETRGRSLEDIQYYLKHNVYRDIT